MKILGIDPGLANTGWAVIEVVQGGQPVVVETGLLTTDNKTIQAQRIAVIVTNIVAVMERFDAEHVAMERVFVGPLQYARRRNGGGHRRPAVQDVAVRVLHPRLRAHDSQENGQLQRQRQQSHSRRRCPGVHGLHRQQSRIRCNST